MRKALIVGAPFRDLDVERQVLAPSDLSLAAAAADPAALRRVGRDAVALLVGAGEISDEVLAALPALRIVSRYGAGLDNIDLAAAARRDIAVAYVPDYGVEEVAVHAVTLVLASVRRLAAHDRNVRRGLWDHQAAGSVPRLSGLTAGVVGMGRIGRKAAELLQPLVGRVIGHDPLVPADAWPARVSPASLEEVFSASDVITLHLPLTPDTAGLVDQGMLSRMPPGAHLVNTARGGLIDLDALLWALDAVPLGGAALDVLPQEPPPAEHPLMGRPEVTLTPHAAWFSAESERDLREKTARNVSSFLETGTPIYPVELASPAV